MKVLVACEESQVVANKFREAGHEAYSCDLEPCSGGHPEWHIVGDAVDESRKDYDLMIAHPPCTYLTVTGNKWMKPEFRERFPDRPQQREEAVAFFMELMNSPIPRIAVENPVGIMSTRFRKPDQYVHPYHFGDPHSKKTGLWIKNLPHLVHTNIVEPIMHTYKDGRKDPVWHMESISMPSKERARFRSKTFDGIATAIVSQWGAVV